MSRVLLVTMLLCSALPSSLSFADDVASSTGPVTSYGVSTSGKQVVLSVRFPNGSVARIRSCEGEMVKLWKEGGPIVGLTSQIMDEQSGLVKTAVFRITKKSGGNEAVKFEQWIDIAPDSTASVRAFPDLAISSSVVLPKEAKASVDTTDAIENPTFQPESPQVCCVKCRIGKEIWWACGCSVEWEGCGYCCVPPCC